MIYVIATIQVKPGQRDTFLGHFRALVPEVLREDGCLEYGPTIDVPTNIGSQPDARDDVIVILEKWESVEHLEAHLIAPHMLTYRQQVKDLVETTGLQVLQPA